MKNTEVEVTSNGVHVAVDIPTDRAEAIRVDVHDRSHVLDEATSRDLLEGRISPFKPAAREFPASDVMKQFAAENKSSRARVMEPSSPRRYSFFSRTARGHHYTFEMGHVPTLIEWAFLDALQSFWEGGRSVSLISTLCQRIFADEHIDIDPGQHLAIARQVGKMLKGDVVMSIAGQNYRLLTERTRHGFMVTREAIGGGVI